MPLDWIPPNAYFDTSSTGVGVATRAAAIAARLAVDEDLVGRRMLLQRLLASVRARFLHYVVQHAPSAPVAAALEALVAAVEGLAADAPNFDAFPGIAAAARACRARAWLGVPIAREEDVVELIVDFATLATADDEATAAETAYRLVTRWSVRDDGHADGALRSFLAAHPLT
ncbi:MAG: hypothetical protein U1E39_13210 [Planctomycetota bacterium]